MRAFGANTWLGSAAAIALAPVAAMADTASAPLDASSVQEIVVTAQKLDVARATIEPSLGATTYSLSDQLVQTLPGGENTALNQVLLQAPGVVQDSFGQLHIRGDHANIQYRINNVILPEGLSNFGQVLSPRLAGNIELITGAVPAQYGITTAGIVNVTTKSGLYAPGGEVSLYGGSHGEIEPSFEYGGSSGATNYFVSGSYLHNTLGIESPDGSADPLHDKTDQIQGFAYVDHIIDTQSRVSFMFGTSDESFQIPNRRGLDASDPDGLGLTVLGQTSFPSEALNERQRENTQFGALSYLHTTDRTTLQVSLYSRYSTLTFRPGADAGDLLFNGISQYAAKTDWTTGLQVEGVYNLTPTHTLRGGVILQTDRSTSDTTSEVLPIDGAGAQTSDVPLTIFDNTRKTEFVGSVYLQDEWKPFDTVTVNYGVRFDQANAYRNENQVSPRVNVVWKPLEGTTLHAGYARYFTPPPFELVASETIAKFAGTTAAPEVTQDDLPRSETDNYYDVGAQQKIGAFTFGIDGYLRDAKNLIDEGQFGAPIILTPFNYAVGRIRGADFTATYDRGPFSAWANFSWVQAQGEHIVSSQFNFAQDDLDYITTHFIFLDHNETFSASGGGSWKFDGLKLSTDFIAGSGLRRDLVLPDGSSIPNGGHVPGYVQVNLSADYHFAGGALGPLDVRFDVINVGDAKYEIRDGTGVGVGAPQFGPRRGFFAGVTKSF
ncbi:MAG TPA: TonB-dependent receptor [Caulobacteraceae bacterium]|nr:TonB-dependent receptor [Caulobacteraceae bacterium]